MAPALTVWDKCLRMNSVPCPQTSATLELALTMGKRPPSIPDSELDVLKVLWDLKSATVREVLTVLQAAGRQSNYATVATLMDRLEEKGFVGSDRKAVAFVYTPLVSAHEVTQKRIASLVDKLYEGEPGLLVLHLLKSHPLDPDQAAEIRALLEQMIDVGGSAAGQGVKNTKRGKA